jgi:hypothetical protein
MGTARGRRNRGQGTKTYVVEDAEKNPKGVRTPFPGTLAALLAALDAARYRSTVWTPKVVEGKRRQVIRRFEGGKEAWYASRRRSATRGSAKLSLRRDLSSACVPVATDHHDELAVLEGSGPRTRTLKRLVSTGLGKGIVVATCSPALPEHLSQYQNGSRTDQAHSPVRVHQDGRLRVTPTRKSLAQPGMR